jgi:hypothetical protein
VTSDLRYRLTAYFAVNPDEELTVEDVCIKWDVPPARIHNLLRSVPLSFVTTVRKGRRMLLVAGPELRQA